MSSYGLYCPVAKGAEIFAERWTPIIILLLLLEAHRFSDLQRGLPGISPTLLAARLRRLKHIGLVERRPGAKGQGTEYHLTPAGVELKTVVLSLGEWGARWVLGAPKPRELHPAYLLWSMRRRINRDLLPPRRVVVRFDFRGAKIQSLWLVLEPADVSVCVYDPGFDTDLLVTADLATFHDVWFRRISLQDATREGLVEIEGTPELVQAFPSWLQWSRWADAMRTAPVGASPPLRTTAR